MHNQQIKNTLAYMSGVCMGEQVKEKEYNTDDYLAMSAVVSDIFVASLLSELDEATAKRVTDNIESVMKIALSSTDVSLASHPHYVRGRADGIIKLAFAMKSSEQ
ncbi:hypothetical protein [Yersinia vastinensis]|uniref:hypothetical protein n=1 Tax=Yersinia vastinensis TaxID=2890318 RepID=UPI0011A5132A|nr:hypothetical protein [Yersinia vastinensis]